LSGTALRGGVAGTAQTRPMAPAFRVFRVLRPVRLHRAAIGQLDADRTLHQHGSALDDPHCSSLGAAHGLSARITTISSSRQPGYSLPVCSNQGPRAESTGPNGIPCPATQSASKPADGNDARDRLTPDNTDWTTNMVPPATRCSDAQLHSGSRTWRPSSPPFHAAAGPAAVGITSIPACRPTAHRADRGQTTSSGPALNARGKEPRRRSTSTPTKAALVRVQSTARGQMANAVTLAAPCWPRQSPPHHYRYTDLTYAARQRQRPWSRRR
jgi:hypothetical protein